MTTRLPRCRLLALLTALVLLAACGQEAEPTPEASADSTTPSPSAGTSPEADAPADPGRVVALGEEFLLADMLALGIVPVASTATTADAGFQGVDQFDTGDIEALPSYEPNIERLVALDPDVMVMPPFVLDYIPRETLEGIAEVVVVSDDPRERVVQLGERFGVEAEAEALIADLDAALANGQEAADDDDRTVSIVTVYPGPSVAVWVDGPVEVPATVLDLGYELRPAVEDAGLVEEGRAFLSLEQVALADGDVLVMLQSDTVEGESTAVEEIASDPLWSELPAVQSGAIIELDRLGYPGIPGRIRLIDDLLASLR